MKRLLLAGVMRFALCLTMLVFASQLALAPVAKASGSYSVRVGDTIYLSWSTDLDLYTTNWYCNAASNLQIVSSTATTCAVKGLAASNQTFVVRCNYYYWVDSGIFSYLGSGGEDFYVTVTSLSPTGVSISSSKSAMAGTSFTLTPTVSPSSAQTTFTWRSSNTNVASVSADGTVSANNPGPATITVTTSNGLSDTCAVTVTEPPMTLSSASPANDGGNVSRGAVSTATFYATLSQGTAFSSIQMVNKDSGLPVSGTVSLSGRNVQFTPAQKLANGTHYEWSIPPNAVQNPWGTANAQAVTIGFTTAALEVSSTVPANNATGVAAAGPYQITYYSGIAAGPAYGGITLTRADGTAVPCTANISGGTLTVTPTAPLQYRTRYMLTVPASALQNSNGAVYGFSLSIAFTTELSPSAFGGGDGSAANPYIVTNQDQMLLMQEYPTANYALGNDIALTGSWMPVGNSTAAFSGSLDGRGHSITNLMITSPVNGMYYGLFGRCVNATFRNLNVSTSSAGVAIGTAPSTLYCGVLAAYGSMTVDNCSVQGKIVSTFNTDNVNTSPSIGGLAGRITSGAVYGSSSSVTVSATCCGTAYVGGLVGYSSAVLSGCACPGLVGVLSDPSSSDVDMYVGGLVGYSDAKIYNCVSGSASATAVSFFSNGDFAYSDLYLGGFVGYASANIYNCVSNMGVQVDGFANMSDSVMYTLHAGGFAGNVLAGVNDCFSKGTVAATPRYTAQTALVCAGFVAQTGPQAVVQRCYSTGNVISGAQTSGRYQNARSRAGGFVTDNSGKVLNCYATGSATSSAIATGTGATSSASASGFVMNNTATGTVSNCYSTGAASYKTGSGSYTAGMGFTGTNSGTLSGCYYDKTTSGCTDSTGGSPKTTAELSQASTFTGWDFDGVWKMDAAKSVYPQLRTVVENVPVTAVAVQGACGDTEIAEDDGVLQFTATATPVYATNRAVNWSVDDTSVATVDANGLLKAVANGTVVVKATAADGSGVCSQCTVTISNQIVPVSRIDVTVVGGTATIDADRGTLQLTAAVLPVKATNRQFTWSVDVPEVASISAGGLLSAKTNGTVTARATASDGSGVFGELKITVSGQILRTAEGYQWQPLDSGDVMITGYEGAGGNLSVPGTIAGKPVTIIGQGAFKGNSAILSVTLPHGLEQVGADAFNDCRNLSSVSLPDTLTVLSTDCFSGTALSSVSIPASVADIDAAFGVAGKLTNITVAADNAHFSSQDGVLFNKAKSELILYPAGRSGAYTIPDGVQSVDAQAFRGSLVSSVVFPATLQSVGDCAFQSCAKLAGVTLPEGTQTVGAMAFAACDALQTAAIPASLTELGDQAFSNCPKLQSIEVALANANYQSADGVLVDRAHNTLLQYPTGETGGEYTVPPGLTQVAARAFAGCSGLGLVNLPEGIVSVGDSAFGGCQNLRSAYFAGKKPTFGEGAFDHTAAGFQIYYHVRNEQSWSEVTGAQAYVNAAVNNGDSTAPQTRKLVLDNGFLPKPADPKRTGYRFSGWYRDAACKDLWDFAATAVFDDVELFARWTLNQYTVTYDSRQGSSVSSVTVDYLSKLIKPADPERTGYTFAGWYRQDAFVTAWVFDTDTVADDTTLYAKWNVITYTVTFDSRGGGSVPDIPVNYGSIITAAVTPVWPGYTFTGWFRDANCTQAWNLSADTVTDDVTLYAGWVVQTPCAVLAGIDLSAGSLSTAFKSSTANYTVNLGEYDTSVTVKPVLAYDYAALTIDGKPVGSKTVWLANGKSATMSVKVTLGKTSKTYKLTIRRPKSTDNTLLSLTPSAGLLDQTFNAGVTQYQLLLPEGTPSVKITAVKSSALASVSPSSRTYKLKNGQTITVSVKVRAQSGATRTYKVTITRAKSTNTNLAYLKPSIAGILTPGFSPAGTDYTAVLPAKSSSVTFSFKAADGLSKVTINGKTCRSVKISLKSGQKITATIVVTAQSGDKKVYTVQVSKP